MIAIQVLGCRDLKRPDQGLQRREMQPFFFYQFYTFEYTSPSMQGSSPTFDIRKQFQIEYNEQFIEYMKTQVLRIELIDESVDLSRAETKDYIGSVRIWLKELLSSPEIGDDYPVRDEAGQEAGHMRVRLSIRDVVPLAAVDEKDPLALSRYAERDILGKIAERFADTLIESVDMIFDMLIEPGSYDSQKVSKERFRDYLLQVAGHSLREQDLDILLKTNPLLRGKDFIELGDFRALFEGPVA